MHFDVGHDDNMGLKNTLTFYEAPHFTRRWRSPKLDDDDLSELHQLLMRHPKGGETVKGTGGLRKMRFSPTSWNRGKRAAAVVCYTYFESHSVIYLLDIHGTAEQEHLSPTQAKDIKAFISRQKKAYEESGPTGKQGRRPDTRGPATGERDS